MGLSPNRRTDSPPTIPKLVFVASKQSAYGGARKQDYLAFGPRTENAEAVQNKDYNDEEKILAGLSASDLLSVKASSPDVSTCSIRHLCRLCAQVLRYYRMVHACAIIVRMKGT